MLKKVQAIAIVGLVLSVLRSFGLEAPEEFGRAVEAVVNALYVIVPVIVGWWVPESRAKLQKLRTKP